MNWDEIYRNTPLEDLHWYPGEVDEVLQQAISEGWLTGRRLLDVGAGQGTDALYLATRGYEVTCLDLSIAAREIALGEAHKAGVALDYRVGSALAMDLPDCAFDGVVERGCFHHIALGDRERYAAEIARVMKPGGTYLYRSFCAKSQFRAAPEELLTEEAVRAAFSPWFTILRFDEYLARGQGGRSQAAMHVSLMQRNEVVQA